MMKKKWDGIQELQGRRILIANGNHNHVALLVERSSPSQDPERYLVFFYNNMLWAYALDIQIRMGAGCFWKIYLNNSLELNKVVKCRILS